MFECKNCKSHQQELREMRMANEAEKQQIYKEHKDQMQAKDAMIKDLHDRLMSRDLLDMETAKNPQPEKTEEIKEEEEPYVDLAEVPLVIPKEDIEKTLNGNQ